MDMKIDKDGKFWSTLIVEKTREYCNVIDIFALYINVIENRIRESKKKRNREKKKNCEENSCIAKRRVFYIIS
jgi:hypothetical protein